MSDQPEVAPQIAELIKMFPQIGFQKVLGIEVVETVPDRAVVRLPHRITVGAAGRDDAAVRQRAAA